MSLESHLGSSAGNYRREPRRGELETLGGTKGDFGDHLRAGRIPASAISLCLNTVPVWSRK